MSIAEIRDRLLAQNARLRAVEDEEAPGGDGKCPECGADLVDGKCPECDDDEDEGDDEGCVKALLVESEKSGHVFMSAPFRVVEEAAGTDVQGSPFLYLDGRFVEADHPNGNGALWTSADLELATATVASGPLNWLHEERHIIGSIVGASFRREQAARSHITASSVVWRYLWPEEARAIERASAERQLWYSMECVSRTVTCLSCDGTFEFEKAIRRSSDVCRHIQQRTSVRRFNEPTFLGGAVILPPFRPGWSGANAEVVRQAARLAEAASLGETMEKADAEAMVAQILAYANA